MKPNLLSILFLALFMQQFQLVSAQNGSVTVNGLKPDNVWQVVEKALSEKGVAIDKFQPDQNRLTTTFMEFTAMMVKNHARLQFDFAGDVLMINAIEKQYISGTGWVDAVIKGTQAEKQLIPPVADKINAILSDPAAVQKAIEQSTLIPAKNKPAVVQGAVTSVSNTVTQVTAKFASIDNAVKVIADELMPFSEGLAAVKKGEKWGFIDTTGKLIIPITLPFKDMQHPGPYFSNGLCMLQYEYQGYDQAVKYIDKSGKDIINNTNYYKGSSFSEGIALVLTQAGKFVFIDIKGAVVPAQPKVPVFSDVNGFNPFSEGLSHYFDQKAGKYGYINKKGGIAIDPVFENAEPFSEGLALVKKTTETGEDKWGFIDKTGKVVIDCIYSKKPSSFSDGFCVVENKDWVKGYINKEGSIVLPPKYKYASDFFNGYAFVTEDGLNYYYVMDKGGKKIAELPIRRDFKLLSGFKDGVAVYDEGRGYSAGTITPEGRIKIMNEIDGKTNFKKIGEFNCGRATAETTIGNQWTVGYINYAGDFVVVLGTSDF
jgi:hypothetical protein